MAQSTFKPNLSRRSFVQAIAVTTALVGLGGCTRVLSEVAAFGADVKLHDDIPYGPGDRHKLDLYIPEGATADTPVILFLYGGSWKWGSRGRYGFVGYSLASQGFAVAVADYRLYPEVRFPDFNYDGALAVAWLQKNRSRFGIGQGAVHLMGHSAGAHIAALIALDPTYLSKWGMKPTEIGSVTGLAGPYGMYPSRVNFIADIFPSADQEDAARPVTFASAAAPPMLLLHGASDGLVSPQNSLLLADRQTKLGAQARAHVYENVGHKEIIVALTNPFQGLAPVLEDVTTFISSIKEIV